MVLTRSDDRTARVWRVDLKGEPLVLRCGGEIVRAAAFSPDGERVVVAGDDDANDRNCILDFSGRH